MSGVSQRTKNKSTASAKEILSMADTRPFLSCSSMMERTASAHTKKRSEDDVARAWIQGVITKSDIFVVEAVYLLSFGTVESITNMLKFMKEIHPDKLIPAVNLESVQNRVYELCNQGVLGGTKYIVVDEEGNKKVANIYTCVHNAFRLLKKQLGYSIYQDDMLLALSDLEVFSRVASSYCALIAANSVKGTCLDARGYGEDRTLGKEARIQFYGTCKLRRKDDSILYMVFEPLYHNYDRSLIEERDVIEKHMHRLKLLYSWVLKAEMEKGGQYVPKVVLVCEDRKGFTRAFAMIQEHIPELQPYVYYTTEYIVRSRCKNEPERFFNSIFSLSQDAKGMRIKVADKDELML